MRDIEEIKKKSALVAELASKYDDECKRLHNRLVEYWDMEQQYNELRRELTSIRNRINQIRESHDAVRAELDKMRQ